MFYPLRPHLPPFRNLVPSSLLVNMRVVRRDGPVVEFHEGAVAVGTPFRQPEIAPVSLGRDLSTFVDVCCGALESNSRT